MLLAKADAWNGGVSFTGRKKQSSDEDFLSKAAHDLRHMDTNTARYFEITESMKYYPRFWQQGKIMDVE